MKILYYVVLRYYLLKTAGAGRTEYNKTTVVNRKLSIDDERAFVVGWEETTATRHHLITKSITSHPIASHRRVYYYDCIHIINKKNSD
jgi:hypothetical protein